MAASPVPEAINDVLLRSMKCQTAAASLGAGSRFSKPVPAVVRSAEQGEPRAGKFL